MDSGEFHNRLVKAIKDALLKWDFHSNPLQWEGLPQGILDLNLDMMREMLSDSRKRFNGAPFYLDYGSFNKKEHIPPEEAVIKMELLPLADADDWVGDQFNLADAILQYADGGDEGWIVEQAITSLEGTIKRLKAESVKRSWDIGQYA